MRLLSLFALLLLISCNRGSLKNCEELLTPCGENVTKTNIRIKNNSKYNFCNVTQESGPSQTNYGILKHGKTTCYHSFNTAYRYAHIQFYIGDKKFEFRPFDYVGETPLGAGKFTYVIDITDFDSGMFSITLKQD